LHKWRLLEKEENRKSSEKILGACEKVWMGGKIRSRLQGNAKVVIAMELRDLARGMVMSNVNATNAVFSVREIFWQSDIGVMQRRRFQSQWD
jgi:hypothetical protein